MTQETRREMIGRLIDERARREAERYKDKQLDEPADGYIAVKFMIGTMVVLRCDVDRVLGFVTGVIVRQSGACYLVTWGDSRSETDHYEFEIEPADQG